MIRVTRSSGSGRSFPEKDPAMIPKRHTAAAGAAALLALSGVITPAHAVMVAAGPGGGACMESEDAKAGESAGARTRDGSRDLDHRDISAAEQAAIEAQMDAVLAAKGGSRRSADGVVIPTYVHVMEDTAGSWDVTDRQIRDQVAVLNKTFGGQESSEAATTGFSFELAGIDRWRNDSWSKDTASNKYRSLTRQGGPDALNVWIVNFKFLGVATFPWDYPQQGDVDGVRIAYDTLPGEADHNYNQGETATHEVGHWLGLYHPFQGGCRPPGDEVADTPYQAVATRGCPEGQDSCPDQPGYDAIHNYMDYSYDSCYNQFTAGQAQRMWDSWNAFRAEG